MSETQIKQDHGKADARADWTAMAPADFDTAAPLVQGALFAKPDPMGAPALFGGVFGEDLA